MSQPDRHYATNRRLAIRFASDRAVLTAARKLAAKVARRNFIIERELMPFFLAGYTFAVGRAKIVRKK